MALMKEGSGGVLLFILPLGEQQRYTIRLHFQASNNVVEYEALKNSLCCTVELGIRCLNVRGDSRLVVGQVMKDSECSDPRMAAYCKEVRQLEDSFDSLELNHILRQDNEVTYTL